MPDSIRNQTILSALLSLAVMVATSFAISPRLLRPVFDERFVGFMLMFASGWGLIFNFWMLLTGRHDRAFRASPGAETYDTSEQMSLPATMLFLLLFWLAGTVFLFALQPQV